MNKPYRVEIVGDGLAQAYAIVFIGADGARSTSGRTYPLPGLPEELCRELNVAFERGRRGARADDARAAPFDEWPFRGHRTLADIDRDTKAVAP